MGREKFIEQGAGQFLGPGTVLPASESVIARCLTLMRVLRGAFQVPGHEEGSIRNKKVLKDTFCSEG